jgi:DegV family protein with EDD domain
MRKVAVITDGTCCLPPELVKRYDIRLLPLYIVFREKSYRDGVDITPAEVYKIMRRRKDLPTTSTPSVGDFLDAYREASHEAESILCITLTGLQSKTYEAALVASEKAREVMPKLPIEVIDSRAVAGALGFVVLEAARAAYRGADLAQAADVARTTMQKVGLLAMVDTLYYLARTGRIARAAAWAATILDMKPVLEHTPAVGETTPVARPRTRAKAVQLMLKLMAERAGNSKLHVIVHHADELEDGKRLKETIGSRFNCAELYLTEFTPGMGVHAGPGVLAMSFYIE